MATVQRTKAPATTASKTNGGGKAAPAATSTTASTATVPGQDPIALRAYQIWQESGCPHGKDKEHWFRAEREVRAATTGRS